MANPELHRDNGRGPLGTRKTPSSPDNNLEPLWTPGPWRGCGVDRSSISPSVEVDTAPCQYLYLIKPFLVGMATDTYLTPTNPIKVIDQDLPNKATTLRFGQDVEFGCRAAPQGHSVGTTEADLRPKFYELLDEFASGDTTNMARRLFDRFLQRKSQIEIFEDPDMNAAIARHPNFIAFADRTLGIPSGPSGAGSTVSVQGTAPTAIRLHQALRQSNWDINKVSAITDLGVPAFKLGSKSLSTGDFNTGLGVMINGVQYVLVYAEKYFYDCMHCSYDITLRFVLYDVFGLDDDDLNEFGAESKYNWSDAKQGITAWWQLQHQFGFAPLLTRAEITREYKYIGAFCDGT